jgi:DNA-binding transcriptional MerR regulator
MNIKEIENKTGLERATIRYYEAEGLLQPQRRENGYRDYSAEDLTTLQRIRFLRQLGLPLEEIGKIQRGETQLSEAMERRLVELVRQSKEYQRQIATCRSLRDEGVTWQTLDAEKYAKTLPAERKTAYNPPERLPGYPWRRLLAWGLDVALCLPLPWAAFVAIFDALIFAESASELADGENVILFFAVMVLVFGPAIIESLGEALALHLTGTTLGKWLMGISLEDRNGCRPTFAAALGSRTHRWTLLPWETNPRCASSCAHSPTAPFRRLTSRQGSV